MPGQRPSLPRCFDVLAMRQSAVIVHDQEDASTCTAHAITACHEILTGRRLRTRDIYPTFVDETEGAKPSECVSILAKVGQRAYEEIPLTKKRSRYLVSDEDGLSSEMYKLKCLPIERDIPVIKSKLCAGLPVVVGMHWHDEKNSTGTIVLTHTMDSKCGDSRRRSTRSQQKQPKQGKQTKSTADDEESGKHCLLITGYLDEEDAEGGGWFMCMNSHGPKWGDKGMGKISYGAFMSFFIDGFVPVFRSKIEAV